jgi:hypothetical protein
MHFSALCRGIAGRGTPPNFLISYSHAKSVKTSTTVVVPRETTQSVFVSSYLDIKATTILNYINNIV